MKQCIAILVCLSFLSAQGFFRSSSLHLGYTGEMVTHPGVHLGADQTIRSMKFFGITLRERLFYYSHKRNHDIVGVQLGVPVEFPCNRPVRAELTAGTGYLLKIIHDGEIYYREGDSLESKDAELFHRFSLSVGTSISFPLITKESWNLRGYLRPAVFWEYPYNDMFLMHGELSVGVTWAKGGVL